MYANFFMKYILIENERATLRKNICSMINFCKYNTNDVIWTIFLSTNNINSTCESMTNISLKLGCVTILHFIGTCIMYHNVLVSFNNVFLDTLQEIMTHSNQQQTLSRYECTVSKSSQCSCAINRGLLSIAELSSKQPNTVLCVGGQCLYPGQINLFVCLH